MSESYGIRTILATHCEIEASNSGIKLVFGEEAIDGFVDYNTSVFLRMEHVKLFEENYKSALTAHIEKIKKDKAEQEPKKKVKSKKNAV